MASERGPAQTGRAYKPASVARPVLWDAVGPVCRPAGKLPTLDLAEETWKGPPERVIAPYAKDLKASRMAFPSTAGHVKPRGNLGRPLSKAKYELATDSELVP